MFRRKKKAPPVGFDRAARDALKPRPVRIVTHVDPSGADPEKAAPEYRNRADRRRFGHRPTYPGAFQPYTDPAKAQAKALARTTRAASKVARRQNRGH